VKVKIMETIRGAAPEEEEHDKYLLYVVSTHALAT
jgi:hypothetical protein